MCTPPERSAGKRTQSNADCRFHLRLAYTFSIILILCFVGCKFTSVHVQIGESVIASMVAVAMLSPLPIYWHEKHRPEMRDSTLVIPWELFLAIVLPVFVLVAGRLRMPLQDSLFGRIDQSLGVSVPGISEWADHHWLGTFFNKSYPLLVPLLAVVAFAPALLGKLKYAREFLLANLAAFAIGLPAFALLPAVGPWYFYHLTPHPAQAHCQAGLFALRLTGPYVDSSQVAGIICFPSFHVIWAILCAAAMWGFRPLRIPVTLLSGMIIVSTVTTGWHYFSDVLAGVVIAILSLAFAKACTRGIGTDSHHLPAAPSQRAEVAS